MSNTNKSDGYAVELRVALRALEQGLSVAEPFGDNERYDLALGKDALHKVQVKSTAALMKSKTGGHYTIKAGHGRTKRRYTSGHIDFLVAYVHPTATFYVIPVGAIKKLHMQLYPHRDNPAGFYEEYKEAWHLIT